MNIKDYIVFGILEEYVMGVIFEQEMQEVKCMLYIYLEIKVELLKLEDVLGQYVRLYERILFVELKNRIFGEMEFGNKEEKKEESVQEFEVIMVKVVLLWSKILIVVVILLVIYVGLLYYDNQ